MAIIHEYYYRHPGCQSWFKIDKIKYFNLRRRKGSKETVIDGVVKHYLEIPMFWIDEFNLKYNQ